MYPSCQAVWYLFEQSGKLMLRDPRPYFTTKHYTKFVACINILESPPNRKQQKQVEMIMEQDLLNETI